MKPVVERRQYPRVDSPVKRIEDQTYQILRQLEKEKKP
jgi:hypothetical protein